MRRFFSSLLLGSLVLSIGGTLFFPLVAEAVDSRVLVVGDSQGNGLISPLRSLLTSGGLEVVGDETWTGWRTNYFFNGRPGTPSCPSTSLQCRPAGNGPNILQDTVNRTHPDVVLFILGGNDYPTSSLSSDIRRVVEISQSSASKIIWVGTAFSEREDVETRHRQVAGVQQSVLGSLGENVTWIDGVPGSQPGPFSADHVHLTGSGYSRWASELAPEIIRIAGGDASGLPATGAATSSGGVASAGGGTGELGAITAPCPTEVTSVFPIRLGVRIGALGEVNGLAEYINAAYRYLVSIVLVVAIVMVVYGGFRYLVGAGVGGVQRGKEIIRDAIMGMLIVLGAYVILQTVNPATVSLSGIQPTKVGCEEFNLSEASLLRFGPTCETDADCSEGRSCIPTRTVFDPLSAEAVSGGARGVLDSVRELADLVNPIGQSRAIVGGVYGYATRVSRAIKLCTDGQLGSPCGSDVNCTQSGTKCSESWRLCIRQSGNEKGSPCDEDADCASGSCTGSTSDQKTCRGEVETFTRRVYESNGFTVPSSHYCVEQQDCRDPDATCTGPQNLGVKFCLKTEGGDELLHEPCFRTGGGTVTPTACSGFRGTETTDIVCLVCPPTGSSRDWEQISAENDPSETRIGQCKPRSDIGERCGPPT